MLGADAFKPPTHANCDSAWCWDNHMWITIEAKSDESATDALGRFSATDKRSPGAIGGRTGGIGPRSIRCERHREPTHIDQS